MLLKLVFAYLFLVFSSPLIWGQSILNLEVLNRDGLALEGVLLQCQGLDLLQTNAQGRLSLNLAPKQTCTCLLSKETYLDTLIRVQMPEEKPLSLVLVLSSLEVDLQTFTAEELDPWASGHLRAVEGANIYASKKTEIIKIDKLGGNLAVNNPRELYARVAGLNIWENDQSGLQLNIGGRGLSPNRSSNFNTRQNGYDIAADALGYPETYYTPPAQALERIELIRGAASLQYGTQFGGLLNFVLRQGGDKPFNFETENTLGSFGQRSSFNALGGSLAKFGGGKLRYFAYYQYKQGDGWRPFSEYVQHQAYAGLVWEAKQWRWRLEQTKMWYLARQPGGLTDLAFERDARQALRPRNWFKVDWNLTSIQGDYRPNEQHLFNLRLFGLWAERSSLGNLQPIHRVDYGGERDLIRGHYANLGLELRHLFRHQLGGKPQALLTGLRLYRGATSQQQGWGNADSTGRAADFRFLPQDVLRNDYRFPSFNASFFLEHFTQLSKRWTLTPGFRLEYLHTGAEGYYQELLLAPSPNGIDTLLNRAVFERLGRTRVVALAGLGTSYFLAPRLELYANFSQNYRAINFNDLRILNPNHEVDEALRDERGFNADLGLRGLLAKGLRGDMTLFYLDYRHRIGSLPQQRPDPLNPLVIQLYTLRTNIGNARVFGWESLLDWDILALFPWGRGAVLQYFVNFAYLDGRYTQTSERAALGRRLEFVAPITFRTGLEAGWKHWRIFAQYAYTGAHFSDATNAERSVNAVVGRIPAYGLFDASLRWTWQRYRLQFGCNNLTDRRYFTRRAVSYPGPGILPGEGRSFYLSLRLQLFADNHQ